MNSAISIEFPYTPTEWSKLVIQASYKILLIPLNIFSFILVLIATPFVELALWRLLKKLRKIQKQLQEEINSLSYEQVKEGYEILTDCVKGLEKILSEVNTSEAHLVQGILIKLEKCLKSMITMRIMHSNVLYIRLDKQPPLTKAEKESYDWLNEVWGNDDDEVYAKHTHHHLSQKTSCHHEV